MDAKDFTKKESPCERKSFCDMESIFSILRGDDRIRTGDRGFADLCLATWLRRRRTSTNASRAPVACQSGTQRGGARRRCEAVARLRDVEVCLTLRGGVGAGAAVADVRLRAAGERVVAARADEHVVAATAVERVHAVAADHTVHASPPVARAARVGVDDQVVVVVAVRAQDDVHRGQVRGGDVCPAERRGQLRRGRRADGAAAQPLADDRVRRRCRRLVLHGRADGGEQQRGDAEQGDASHDGAEQHR